MLPFLLFIVGGTAVMVGIGAIGSSVLIKDLQMAQFGMQLLVSGAILCGLGKVISALETLTAIRRNELPSRDGDA